MSPGAAAAAPRPSSRPPPYLSSSSPPHAAASDPRPAPGGSGKGEKPGREPARRPAPPVPYPAIPGTHRAPPGSHAPARPGAAAPPVQAAGRRQADGDTRSFPRRRPASASSPLSRAGTGSPVIDGSSLIAWSARKCICKQDMKEAKASPGVLSGSAPSCSREC